ncbi:MAG: DUF4474 domain-containing protein [Oscillospiraceae bacterium]|jgi:hypothetical protein|nr:DUF4474 domain-containing protein [Oscillospiraceae bacterium]
MLLHTITTVTVAAITLFSGLIGAGEAGEAVGAPVWDTAAYLQNILDKNAKIKRITFGVYPADRMVMTYDETLDKIFDDLAAAGGGFDARDIIAGLPDMHYYNRWIYDLLEEQIVAAQASLVAKADAAYAQGDVVMMFVNRLTGVMLGMPKQLHVRADLMENGYYDIILEITDQNGTKSDLGTQIWYDAEEGLLFHKDDVGFCYTGFDIDVDDAEIWSATNNPLQRSLGYSKLYDDLFLQSRAINVTTVRLKFPYRGQDWLLQLWKGRYFISNGGEVGLYHKEKSDISGFYACASDDERIPMTLTLTTDDGLLLIDRPATLHWWMTGFVLRDRYYTPERMTLETTLTVPDDEMLAGIRAALETEKAKGVLDYSISGRDISIKW